MDPETIRQLVLTAPWGVVIIILRWMDIKAQAEERHERVAEAKEKSLQDREHQIVINKTYADAINNLASVVVDTKNTVIDQYNNIGITQDLLNIAKESLQGERKINRKSGD